MSRSWMIGGSTVQCCPTRPQCLWHDGSAVSAHRPQNQNGVTGHVAYRGTALVFAATKLDDIELLEKLAAVDPATGEPGDVSAFMCLRRLNVYKFRERVGKPKGKITFCAKCFAGRILALGQPSRATFL